MPIPTSQREFERESQPLVDAAEASVISPCLRPALSALGQPEKTFHRYSTAGLPSTAEMPSDSEHRRSVP
jgi:hypothetical protein